MDITGDHRKIDLANINYVLPILYNEELYGLLIHTLNLYCSGPSSCQSYKIVAHTIYLDKEG